MLAYEVKKRNSEKVKKTNPNHPKQICLKQDNVNLVKNAKYKSSTFSPFHLFTFSLSLNRNCRARRLRLHKRRKR